MKLVLSDCQINCLQAVKRWNLGVEGVTPGSSPPVPMKLQLLDTVPRDLIEIELFGKFPREQVQRELAELNLSGLLRQVVCQRVSYASIIFTTLDCAHAEIEVSEADGNGRQRVVLRRPPLAHIRSLFDKPLGYMLKPHGVEALADIEVAPKTSKSVNKHHFFPEIKTPLARFLDLADMAYQQDLSGSTYSDGRPAYSGKGPLRNWGDVQEAYEEAKAFVLELANAQIIEKALNECFDAIRESADAQNGGSASDRILHLAGKFITARNRLRGYLKVMPIKQRQRAVRARVKKPKKRESHRRATPMKKVMKVQAKASKNHGRGSQDRGLKLKEGTRLATWHLKPLRINTSADFKVLKCLWKSKGNVVSYSDLLHKIKPGNMSDSVNLKTSPIEVREAVSHLRRALRKVNATVTISNIRFVGYQLQISHK